MGFEPGTNNHAELLALKVLLLFAKQKNIQAIRVFGDSMLVINWIRETQICHNLMLLPLLEEVLNIVSTFDSSLKHVYRERNEADDRLSKAGLQLAQGHIEVKETDGDTTSDYIFQPMI
jgi:ribonuclease HI